MSQYAPFLHLISTHNNKYTTVNVMVYEYIITNYYSFFVIVEIRWRLWVGGYKLFRYFLLKIIIENPLFTQRLIKTNY